MSESAAVVATVEACKGLRKCERLLASAGFYKHAGEIRTWREAVEKCSMQSVADLRPDEGQYSPKTIGKLVDEGGAA